MLLNAALDTLTEQMGSLREALWSLRVTAIEDRPPHDELVLVDRLGDTVEELLGWLAECAAETDRTRRSAHYGRDAEQVSTLLTSCEAHVQRLEADLCTLRSYDNLAPLLQQARKRGGEWASWLQGVREALDRAQACATDVRVALLCCWQATVEQAMHKAVRG